MDTSFIVQTLPARFFRWHSVIVLEDGTTLTVDPMFGRRRASETAQRFGAAFIEHRNAHRRTD